MELGPFSPSSCGAARVRPAECNFFIHEAGLSRDRGRGARRHPRWATGRASPRRRPRCGGSDAAPASRRWIGCCARASRRWSGRSWTRRSPLSPSSSSTRWTSPKAIDHAAVHSQGPDAVGLGPRRLHDPEGCGDLGVARPGHRVRQRDLDGAGLADVAQPVRGLPPPAHTRRGPPPCREPCRGPRCRPQPRPGAPRAAWRGPRGRPPGRCRRAREAISQAELRLATRRVGMPPRLAFPVPTAACRGRG